MKTLARTLLAVGALLGVFPCAGCSSGGGTSSEGGQAGSNPASSATGGSTGGLTSVSASGGNTAGTSSTGSVGGTGGASASSVPSSFANVGVCGARGKATVDATSFEGYEERYLIGEQGFGTTICAVRFELKRVGDAPPGCTACTWTHLLEYSKASVMTDEDGVCASSDLGLNAPAIAKIIGTRIAVGFAEHLGGAHGSARMTYFADKQMWDVAGNASWSEASTTFAYDDRQGLCNYGP